VIIYEQDSHCPFSLSSKTAAKGKDLDTSVGKGDPPELDYSLTRFDVQDIISLSQHRTNASLAFLKPNYIVFGHTK